MLIVAGQTVIARANGETPVPDVDSINSGRAIYEQHCASCHGANAEGAPNWQERDARGELPAPPHNAEGHTWRHSDAALYEMVSKGWRDPFNKSKRLTMPAFGGEMSPAQIRAVIGYLKTLWTPEQRQFQSEETRDHPAPSRMP
ncbi:MAG: cytochrome c [Rhodospirillales bacterium]|nr:cytochrome c [Rhodospirillales bacterium]